MVPAKLVAANGMSILVINTGSTSLKFGVFDAGARGLMASGSIDWSQGDRRYAKLQVRNTDGTELRSFAAVPNDFAAAKCAIHAVAGQTEIGAVGHRVVHGGNEFKGSVWVDQRVKGAIDRLAELAPLHNPPALAAIEAVESSLPGTPQVAVFDTAFFSGLPPRAFMYPVPYDWYEQWGVRRMGFHGISNTYCLQRAAELLGSTAAPPRLITCHLGGGCSVTAVKAGQPGSTTMGFTPLEGLMMGTRCGSIDPGILIYLQRNHGMDVESLDLALHHRSGLLGISGVSAIFSQVEAAAQDGNERARLALEMFADRVREAIGGLAVRMGGVGALVFTGRIGGSSPGLRTAVCEGLECLGLQLDPDENAKCQPDADIASKGSQGRILAIQTNEELVIARETRRVTRGG